MAGAACSHVLAGPVALARHLAVSTNPINLNIVALKRNTSETCIGSDSAAYVAGWLEGSLVILMCFV